MAATQQDIAGWFLEGVKTGATHMIVVYDTFSHDDYPVYVMPTEDVHEKVSEYHGPNMQRVMEVYNLRLDMGAQLGECRAFYF